MVKFDFFYSHLILNDHPTFDGAFIIQIVEPQELNKMLSGWRVQNDTTWRDEYIIFAERNGDVLFCDTQNITSPVYGSIQKRNFIEALDNLIAEAEIALKQESHQKALAIWNKHLGNKFPVI